jgi:hypothetical protein
MLGIEDKKRKNTQKHKLPPSPRTHTHTKLREIKEGNIATSIERGEKG